jgi:hypothetical protein
MQVDTFSPIQAMNIIITSNIMHVHTLSNRSLRLNVHDSLCDLTVKCDNINVKLKEGGKRSRRLDKINTRN